MHRERSRKVRRYVTYVKGVEVVDTHRGEGDRWGFNHCTHQGYASGMHLVSQCCILKKKCVCVWGGWGVGGGFSFNAILSH